MSVTNDRSRRWATLGVVAGGNFVQLGTRILLSPIVPLVLIEFETTKSSVGVALTGMWAIYALLQFPSGVLADRYGERRLILAALGGTAVGTALVAFSSSLLAFGAFVLVLGAGAGLFFSPATSLITRLYDEQGGPLGVIAAAAAIAGVVFPAVGGAVAVQFGWRVALGLGAITVLPLFLATAWIVPSMAPANPDRTLRAAVDIDRVSELLTRPSIVYTTVIAVLTGFALQALTSFLPTFLVEYRGIDTGEAGLLFGAIFGISTVAQPVAGRISDRLTRDAAVALSVAVAGVGLSVLLAVGGTTALLVGAALLGLGKSWMAPLQARFMDQFESGERGYGFGLVRTVYMLLAATGSVVAGTLAESSGWMVAYGLIVALFVVCLIALALNRALSLDL